MALNKLAVKLFGRLAEYSLDYFDSIKVSMHKAGMRMQLLEYVSLIYLAAAMAFIVSLIGGSIFLTLLIPSAPFTFTMSIIISFMVTGFTFFMAYYYPTLLAKNKKTKIDRNLPFAVFYMATSASAGIDPPEIFRLLSQRGGVIGNEASKIYTDVRTLGMNLATALQKAAQRTPSVLWSELLWGMSSVLTTGGSIDKFLEGKTRTFMNQYRRSLEEYSKQIALYTEIYITLIIVGSLFFIILISIVSPIIGQGTLFIQTLLVFFLVPLVSLGFIMILKGISPRS
ncbi:MAG: type II secretion system F family protein [Candidatus Aenigmarchaeota archaeon]|nr:type II secretion system F family protein [Candidatus Aenigmarchaeota archaeon]